MAFINLGQVMWPVGSIYISENNISPGSIFGGNWEELKADACLMATGENGASTYTGSKKITIDQMPNHAHATHWSPSGDESKGYGLNKTAWFTDRPCVYQNTGRVYGTPVGGGKTICLTLSNVIFGKENKTHNIFFFKGGVINGFC